MPPRCYQNDLRVGVCYNSIDIDSSHGTIVELYNTCCIL